MKKLLLTSLLVLAAAGPVGAQVSMMHHGEGYGPGMEIGSMERMGSMMGMCLKHADQIGLTDEQAKKVTPLHREMEKSQVRFAADLKIAEMDLRDILGEKDFDLEKASATVKKIGDLKTAHHLELLKSMREVRSVLTEEQFQKMKKMVPGKDVQKGRAHKMRK